MAANRGSSGPIYKIKFVLCHILRLREQTKELFCQNLRDSLHWAQKNLFTCGIVQFFPKWNEVIKVDNLIHFNQIDNMSNSCDIKTGCALKKFGSFKTFKLDTWISIFIYICSGMHNWAKFNIKGFKGAKKIIKKWQKLNC